MNFFTKSVIASITFLVMAVFVATLVFVFGPTVESVTSPVVKTTNVISIPTESPDTLRILLTSVKLRETCELLDRVVSVRVGPDTWVRGTIFFKDPATGNFAVLGKSRPAGDRVIDEVQIKPKGVGLHIVLFHRCHPLWVTTTVQTYKPTFESQK